MPKNHGFKADLGHFTVFRAGPHLAPQQKLFLLNLLLDTSEFAGDIGTLGRVEQRFGVKREVARKVLGGYLYELGVVKKLRGPQSSAVVPSSGRPRIMYAWDSTRAFEWLRSIHKEPKELYFEATRALLKNRSFRVNERLLLAALLSRADLLGAVYELGTGEITQLTGLKRDKLKETVAELIKKGYLASYTPGGSISAMLGTVASSYLVNIKTVLGALGLPKPVPFEEYELTVGLPTNETLGEARRLGKNLVSESQKELIQIQLTNMEKRLDDFPGTPALSCETIRYFFGASPKNARFIELLAAKVNKLASQTLVNDWSKLATPSSLTEPRSTFVEALASELKHRRGHSVATGSSVDHSEAGAETEMAGFLVSLGQYTAKRIFLSLTGGELRSSLPSDPDSWDIKAASIFSSLKYHNSNLLKIAFVKHNPVRRYVTESFD